LIGGSTAFVSPMTLMYWLKGICSSGFGRHGGWLATVEHTGGVVSTESSHSPVRKSGPLWNVPLSPSARVM
jgi:hypothetical protein